MTAGGSTIASDVSSTGIADRTPRVAPVLGVAALRVGRGDRVLVDGFDLVLTPGQAVHLKGRNGAGKTTLLETLAGLRAPLAGRVERPSGGLHWLGHRNGLHAALSASENLAYWCAINGCAPQGIRPALERLGLARARHRPVRTLSAGQKRRAALARMVLAPRRLWLLDEPLSGLDAEGLERFGELLAAHLAGGGAALMTSHQPLPGSGEALTLRALG